MKPWSGISRRLLVAFGALVLLFSAATYFAVAGMAEIHHLVHHAQESEANVRAAIEISVIVQELAVHESDALLLPGDDSAARLHQSALSRLRTVIAGLEPRAKSPEQRLQLRELEKLAAELPALASGDVAAARGEYQVMRERRAALMQSAKGLRATFERSVSRFDEHAAATEHATFRWMLFALIGATLFAIAVALYIGRSVARPIAKLEAGANRVAEGDLETRIDIRSRDEFGRLAERFNAMTAALKAHQEQLVQSEKLAGIGRLAAGVAHEISNPLGVIIGYVRLLEQKAEGALADDLKVIADEALRCQEIVDGLLELSRPPRSASVPCALRDLCEEIIGRMRETKQLTAVSVTLDGSATAVGHPQKLRQVLFNLIKNAVDAAGDGGTVRVQLDRDASGVSVTVSDNGPGVPLQLRTRLFEPFFTTKAAGTGLGLAVSQAIAQAHGGNIELDAGPGAGATFKVRLPAP